MITQAELDFDGVITKITMKEELEDSDIEKLTKYVDELKEEIETWENDYESLESEKDELEEEVSNLQDEVDSVRDSKLTNITDLLEEITEERYKYSSGFKYDTKEKILDRLEYILRYEI